MFLGKNVFLTVCLSVCGLINVAIDYRTAISLDDGQCLWIHCDLLDVLTLSNLVATKELPFCEPFLWRPTDLAALSVSTFQNLVCEHTKCLRLRWILL